MTGPAYPDFELPPGSEAIGLFSIGKSPIGTIPLLNIWDGIQSEYANSPVVDALLESLFAALDQTKNFDLFYDNIWNVATAQGYGLDVWGRIVGVNRVVEVSSGSFFGFQEAGEPGITGFNQSPFYSGAGATQNFTLSDAVFRNVIYAKALSNITDGSIPSLNQILLTLFPGRGQCYVANTGPMAMAYTFDFALEPVDEAIVYQSGVLPQPTGVTVTVVVNP
jgi:Protein of unknown function (DUF2612)